MPTLNEVLWATPPKKLLARRSELHIWQIELDLEPNLFTALTSILSPQEIKQANSFVFEEGRRRDKISHAMKRLVLANYLNIPAQSLIFDKNDFGKPFISLLQNSLKVQFNISHSQDLILMAVTLDDPVGIDVEYHATTLSEEALMKHIFSNTEQLFYLKAQNAEEKKTIFYRCWTRKEAYLKATGLGLVENLQAISIDLNESPGDAWLSVPAKLEVKTPWQLFSLDVGELYTASIVATRYQKHLLQYETKDLIGYK